MVGINIACTARINIQSLAIMCNGSPPTLCIAITICLYVCALLHIGRTDSQKIGILQFEGHYKYVYLLGPPVCLNMFSIGIFYIYFSIGASGNSDAVIALLFILIGLSLVVLCNKKQYHVSRWCGFNSQVSSICKKSKISHQSLQCQTIYNRVFHSNTSTAALSGPKLENLNIRQDRYLEKLENLTIRQDLGGKPDYMLRPRRKTWVYAKTDTWKTTFVWLCVFC